MAEKKVPPLTHAYIYLTEECNQHCAHCWVTAKRIDSTCYEYPTAAQYEEFVNQAVPLGLNSIRLSGGEPLLRKEVFPLVEYAAGKGVVASIETNGMLITDEDASFFERMKSSLSISLDGATSVTHDKRRGLKGAFSRTTKAIDILQGYRVPIQIVMAVAQDNLHELRAVLDYVATINPQNRPSLKINPVTPSGRAENMNTRGDLFEVDELLRLVWEVDNVYAKQYEFPIMVHLEPAFFSVNYLLEHGSARCGFLSLICVLATGDISFCAMGYARPEFLMGSVRPPDFNLKAIWEENDVLQRMRQVVPENLDGVCGRCIMKYDCQGGCRAMAVEAYGNMAAPSPWCQLLYEKERFPENRLIA